MNLYLVTVGENKDRFVVYDYYDAHVVAAETVKEARAIAMNDPGAEGKAAWMDATVRIIGTAHKSVESGIVLSSYNAG